MKSKILFLWMLVLMGIYAQQNALCLRASARLFAFARMPRLSGRFASLNRGSFKGALKTVGTLSVAGVAASGYTEAEKSRFAFFGHTQRVLNVIEQAVAKHGESFDLIRLGNGKEYGKSAEKDTEVFPWNPVGASTDGIFLEIGKHQFHSLHTPWGAMPLVSAIGYDSHDPKETKKNPAKLKELAPTKLNVELFKEINMTFVGTNCLQTQVGEREFFQFDPKNSSQKVTVMLANELEGHAGKSMIIVPADCGCSAIYRVHGYKNKTGDVKIPPFTPPQTESPSNDHLESEYTKFSERYNLEQCKKK